jgi:hypothetical protein
MSLVDDAASESHVTLGRKTRAFSQLPEALHADRLTQRDSVQPYGALTDEGMMKTE